VLRAIILYLEHFRHILKLQGHRRVDVHPYEFQCEQRRRHYNRSCPDQNQYWW
jgi:hypothetical protein